jgi:hypothetical protein
MIVADTRGNLDQSDLRLVLLLLSQGSEAARERWQSRLAAEGPDPLLDAPELPGRLMAVRTLLAPSETLFLYVMVRHALRSEGVDDAALADYIAALLLAFGQRDRAWRVDWNDDHRHRYLVDIVADLAAADGDRRFKVMAHLGNYALWLAGVFPDYVAARQLRRGGPGLSYYDSLGRRGFALAADHALADRLGLEGVFRAAADRFGVVREALTTLSDRVFFPNVVTPDRIERARHRGDGLLA